MPLSEIDLERFPQEFLEKMEKEGKECLKKEEERKNRLEGGDRFKEIFGWDLQY